MIYTYLQHQHLHIYIYSQLYTEQLYTSMQWLISQLPGYPYMTRFQLVTHKNKYLNKLFNELAISKEYMELHASTKFSSIVQSSKISQLINSSMSSQLANIPPFQRVFYQYHKCLYKSDWLGVVGSHRCDGLTTCEEVRLPNGLR